MSEEWADNSQRPDLIVFLTEFLSKSSVHVGPVRSGRLFIEGGRNPDMAQQFARKNLPEGMCAMHVGLQCSCMHTNLERTTDGFKSLDMIDFDFGFNFNFDADIFESLLSSPEAFLGFPNTN
jgi:hypothetical protein